MASNPDSSTYAYQKPSTYAYQKPSVLATRTLVSDSKPAELPSTGSHDAGDPHDQKPVLQRRTTDHYRDALATAAAKAGPDGITVDFVESGTDAGSGSNIGSVSTAGGLKPGFDRQPSWKQSDLKRGAVEKMLSASSAGHGYSSTGSA